jgi:hypothetical protein
MKQYVGYLLWMLLLHFAVRRKQYNPVLVQMTPPRTCCSRLELPSTVIVTWVENRDSSSAVGHREGLYPVRDKAFAIDWDRMVHQTGYTQSAPCPCTVLFFASSIHSPPSIRMPYTLLFSLLWYLANYTSAGNIFWTNQMSTSSKTDHLICLF